MELLQTGRAATLLGARLVAIQANLLAKRGQLAAVITDLQVRPPSGDARIDAISAPLCTEASTGLSHVDEFLRRIDIFAARV